MKFHSVVYQDTRRNRRIQTIVYAIVFITVGFSCYLTYEMVRKNIFMTKAKEFVEKEMNFPNTQVLSHKEYIDGGASYRCHSHRRGIA